MKKQTIAFVKDDGESLRVIDAEMFKEFLRDFGAGAKLKLTIEHYHPIRSNKQNSVLHWYCASLSEECGMQVDDFKMMMKMKFLKRVALNKDGEEMADENGEVLTYIPSTASLDKAEMGVFIEQIRLFGIEMLNYVLPEPDENYKLKLEERN